MWLTDLADTARSSGLPVLEVPGWRTRGHGPMLDVRTIVCHHTAGPATGDAPSLAVVRDGRSGLAGPLAQLVLARSGTVHIVAAGLSWHAGVTFHPDQANEYAVGIEAEATGTGAWPVAQMDAYARLCAALCRRYALPPARVLGHKEIAAPAGRKIDPNFPMGPFRDLVRSHLEGNIPDMDPRQAGQLDTALHQLTGSPEPWTFTGWDENVVPRGPQLTLVDLARRNAQTTRALGQELSAVRAAVAKLSVGGVDLDALAVKVADLLAERLRG